MKSGYGDYNVGRELVNAHQAEMRSLRAADRLARQARTAEGGGMTEGWLRAVWRRIWPATTGARRPAPPTARTAAKPRRSASGAWRVESGE